MRGNVTVVKFVPKLLLTPMPARELGIERLDLEQQILCSEIIEFVSTPYLLCKPGTIFLAVDLTANIQLNTGDDFIRSVHAV